MQCEEAIRKRKEEREKLEDRIEENRNADTNTDTKACLLEISEEGKVLLKDNIDSGSAGSDEIKMDAAKKPVTYTKTGEAIPSKQGVSISVSV